MLAWAAVSKLAGESPDFNRAAAQKWLLATAGLSGERIPEIGHDTSLNRMALGCRHALLAGTDCLVGIGIESRRLERSSAHSRRRANAGRSIPRHRRLQLRQHDGAGPKAPPACRTDWINAGGARRREDTRSASRTLAEVFGRLRCRPQTTPISLSYGLLGLTAHDRRAHGRHVAGNRLPPLRAAPKHVAVESRAAGFGVARQAIPH